MDLYRKNFNNFLELFEKRGKILFKIDEKFLYFPVETSLVTSLEVSIE